MKRKHFVAILITTVALCLGACALPTDMTELINTEETDSNKDKKEDKKDKDDRKEKDDKEKEDKENKDKEDREDYALDSEDEPLFTEYELMLQEGMINYGFLSDEEFYETYGMTKDELYAAWEAYEEEEDRESDELFQKFRDEMAKTETEFETSVKEIDITYDGSVAVHTNVWPDALMLNTDDDEFLCMSVYNEGEIEAKSFLAVMEKGTRGTDGNGNTYFEIDKEDECFRYIAYEHTGTLIIISYDNKAILDGLTISSN